MIKYVAVFFINAICLVTTIAQGRVVQLRRTNGAWEYNEQGNNKKEIKIGVNMNEIEGTIQVMQAYVNNLGAKRTDAALVLQYTYLKGVICRRI